MYYSNFGTVRVLVLGNGRFSENDPSHRQIPEELSESSEKPSRLPDAEYRSLIFCVKTLLHPDTKWIVFDSVG
jgi:hypothetical protein